MQWRHALAPPVLPVPFTPRIAISWQVPSSFYYSSSSSSYSSSSSSIRLSIDRGRPRLKRRKTLFLHILRLEAVNLVSCDEPSARSCRIWRVRTPRSRTGWCQLTHRSPKGGTLTAERHLAGRKQILNGNLEKRCRDERRR